MRFPRKIAQEHIAADLGVSRETISRRLNEWERSGLLRTGARSQQIEILDYQRISRLASLRSSRSRTALERSIDDIDAAIACCDLSGPAISGSTFCATTHRAPSCTTARRWLRHGAAMPKARWNCSRAQACR